MTKSHKEKIITMTSDELRQYTELLIEQNSALSFQVDLFALYIMTLNDNTNPTKKAFFECLYYISSTSYEIRLFLESMKAASQDGRFSHLNKYLAIQLYENIDTIPAIVNRINRHATNEVDVQKVKDARKRFSKDLKHQIDLLDMTETLDMIRNHAGAHHLDKEKNIDYLLQLNSLTKGAWGQGKEFYNDAIIALGVYMCAMLNNLAEDLKKSDQSGYLEAINSYTDHLKNNTDYYSDTADLLPRFKI